MRQGAIRPSSERETGSRVLLHRLCGPNQVSSGRLCQDARSFPESGLGGVVFLVVLAVFGERI